MPFLLLLVVALALGSLIAALAAHYPHTAGVSQPSDRAARQIGHAMAAHSRLRRLLRERLDPATATGLALSLSLLVIFLAGLVLGRSRLPHPLELDTRRVRPERRTVGRRSPSRLVDSGTRARHVAWRDPNRDRPRGGRRDLGVRAAPEPLDRIVLLRRHRRPGLPHAGVEGRARPRPAGVQPGRRDSWDPPSRAVTRRWRPPSSAPSRLSRAADGRLLGAL